MQFVTWAPGMSLDENERQIIVAAFDFYKGNKTATASALGISIRTLENKMERYGKANERVKALEAERLRRNEEFIARSRGLIPGEGSLEDRKLNPHKYVAAPTVSVDDLIDGGEKKVVDDTPKAPTGAPPLPSSSMPPTPQQRQQLQRRQG